MTAGDTHSRPRTPRALAPYGALPAPRLTPELLALVRTGDVFSLAVPISDGIPVPTPMVPFRMTTQPKHGDLAEIYPASAAGEVVTAPIHAGTHIDARRHIGDHVDSGAARLHSPDSHEVFATDVSDDRGIRHASVESWAPTR